ncbi:hypothetical protein ABE354_08720 [Brevibacillus laterosporus]|uniref:hypothetical protein n=1 Tax=Brevibacillus laterosporus TaxID=1465 RepID=UPI003D22B3A1
MSEKNNYDRRLADIFWRDLDTELAKMAPVAGQAVCDEARKRFNAYFEKFSLDGGEGVQKLDQKTEANNELQQALDSTVLSICNWANRRLDQNLDNQPITQDEAYIFNRLLDNALNNK